MYGSVVRPSRLECGTAMVEFALVVPLFFLIIFGLVELGIVFAGYCGAEYASQFGVRYAIVHGADNTVSGAPTQAQVATLINPYLWAAQQTPVVAVTWSPDSNTGSTVTVSISLTYKIGIPFFGMNTIHVGTSSQGTILY